MSKSSLHPVYYHYPQWPVNQPAPAFPRVMLPEEAYAQAIAAMVVVCADIVCYQPNGTIWLARRRALPLQSWWYFGGRMQTGETPEQAAARKLKWEAGLDVAPERLRFLALGRFFYHMRQQAPQDTPCDSLAFTFALEVTDDEMKKVASALDDKEYEPASLNAFTWRDLEGEAFHPALRDMYRLIFPNA